MIIRKVDGENDWTFGKGLSNYAIEQLAVEENIKSRILSWGGDCFFALEEGVDWKSRLDVGQADNLLQEIKSVILQSFGVVGVNSIDGTFDENSRLETLTYNIDTVFSENFQKQLRVAA